MTASLYSDDLNVAKVKIEAENHRPSELNQEPVVPFKKEVSAAKPILIVDLAPNGGAVLWLKNVK